MNTTSEFLKRAVTLAVVMMLAPLFAAFDKGSTVVFLGDSITHQARWTGFVTRYYHERLPELNVRFYNAGVGGDTAKGCLGRLHEDVTPRHPSVIVTMFGMNDVGGGKWAEKFGDEENAVKKRILERYETNVTNLAARLRADNPGVKLVWCTPSIYDETAVMERPNNPGRNRELLAGCAAVIKRLAAGWGDGVIDFHAPMTAFNAERQKADPTFTMIGPDRVHPLDPGAFFMACEFLRQQGLDPHAEDPLKPWPETAFSRRLREVRAAEAVLRDTAAFRWFLRCRNIDPDDLEAVNALIAKLKAEGKKGYYEERIGRYPELWKNHAEAEQEFVRRYEALLATVK